MAIVVFGLNHRTAPVAVRERIFFQKGELVRAMRELNNVAEVSESVILSTCNRTEIYCLLLEASYTRANEWLCYRMGMSTAELKPYLFALFETEAVRHLLRVACGLDSMILGEPQILGQLKSAYQIARDAGTVDSFLSRLFEHAFTVAKQVRTDTAIGDSPVSVAFAAVRLAEQIFGDLSNQTALLIGAGETIELVASHLHDKRLSRVIVANRSLDRAQAIASQYRGYAISLSDLPVHLAEADIVVSSTGSSLPILGKGAVERALRQRRHRPVFLVDLAVPRDIEAEISELQDVYLYTVDDLENVIQENLRSRQFAARQAEEIVVSQVHQYMDWVKSLDAVSTICDLRQKASLLRDEAMAKARRQLARGDTPAEVLENLANILTNKLVHLPSVKLREASAQGRGEVLQAARELFELDEPAKR